MVSGPWIAVLLAGLFGAAVGSFLNVVAWRVPRGESILRPASRCTSCGTAIAWFDNLPVLSWFVLRGRCRHCGAGFSIRYAVVELLTGLLFAAALLRTGVSWIFLRDALFLSLLVCTVLTDLDGWIILDTVSLGGTAAGIALSLLPGGVGLLPSVLASAGSFALFLLIRLGSMLMLRRRPGYTLAPEGHEEEAEEFQGGMGWGDIKLAAMIGAFLGPSSAVVAFFLAFLTGALFGVAVLLRGRDRRIPIPFGPFMALGATIALFAGPALWALYLHPSAKGR